MHCGSVYLHLPVIEQHLLAIPASAPASMAYVGQFMYAQLFQASSSFVFHAFAPSAHLSRQAELPGKRCRSQTAGYGQSECSGPMPFACGPFLALGRDLVSRLISRRGAHWLVEADLTALRHLPLLHDKVLEDAWLGSVLWRYLGGDAPINMFSWSAPLVVDNSNRFRAMPSVAVWHNRLKFVNRIAVLFAYHTARNGAYHCSLSARWKLLKKHCCGRLSQLGHRQEGRKAHKRALLPVWHSVTNLTECTDNRGWNVNLLDRQQWLQHDFQLSPRLNLFEQA
jgi:hypothetical protein